MSDSRPVVVTGAGGALGQAVVRVLRDGGSPVVAVDREKSLLDELPADVAREEADLSEAEGAERVFDRIAAGSGAPAGLVNTIGIFRGGSVLETTSDALRQVMGVNFESALWASKAVATHMSEAGGGAIVHVAARNGVEALGGSAAYSVSKAALVHLVRILDAELRPNGIRVNAVVPRLIDTPANRAAFGPDAMKGAVAPEAIAGVIAFLMSDAASPVSGGLIPVYG